MTTLPAVVTIPDLPAGTTATGTELIEAVQTSGGVGNSVKLTLSQAVGTVVGALPPSGGTGQVLKSLGTGFAASWVNLGALATASTGLAAVGSTTVAFALASTAGLSVLGVAATASAVPAAIVGTGAQVLVINDGGTLANFGAVNLGSAAAVTGVLPGANFSAVNLGASGAGGVQGFLPAGSIATGVPGQLLGIKPAGATVAFVGGMMLLNTLSPNNVASTTDTTSLTSVFRNYMITFENVAPVTQTTTLAILIATSGSNFVGGGVYLSAVSSNLLAETNTTFIALSGLSATTSMQTSALYGLSGAVQIFNPSSSVARKRIVGQTSWQAPGAISTATLAIGNIAALFDGSNNPVTGISVLFASGNIQTGTIKIYGLS